MKVTVFTMVSASMVGEREIGERLIKGNVFTFATQTLTHKHIMSIQTSRIIMYAPH